MAPRNNIELKIATQQYRIPYLMTSLQEPVFEPEGMFHILPRPINIALLVKDLIAKYDWSTVAVIYDDTIG